MDGLRAAHHALLKLRRGAADVGDTEFMGLVLDFLRKARATGALLDHDDDRWAAQSLIDYWANIVLDERDEAVAADLDPFDPLLAPILPDEPAPYVGLSAFDEARAGLFFGRQALVDEMVAKLSDNRVLAVIGPSGSGKSSAVMAGLLPRLRQNVIDGSESWAYLSPVVPGTRPLHSLARLFSPEEGDTDLWRRSQALQMRQDPGHLLSLLNRTTDTPALLIIDQFEELFTLTDDVTARGVLINNLLAVIESPDAPHRVILTMRSDFEPRLAAYPVLQDALEASNVRVTAMNSNELREAVLRPAAQVGLKFEDGLVDHLVQTLVGEPAALPLLQFTLTTLWERRERNRITWAAYQALGDGRRALANTADALYDRMIPEDQDTVEYIFLRLARPSEGREITSNRVRRDSLYRGGPATDRIDRVLERLIDAHLVRRTTGDRPEDEQVEVAHEALIRNWPRLVGWLDDARTRLRQHLRLTAAAEQWEAVGRDRSALLRGPLLEEARGFEDLNELEAAFIDASQQALLDEQAAEEAAQREALERAQALAQAQERSANLYRGLVIALAALALLLIVAAVFIGQQSIVAQQNAEAANANAEIAFENATVAVAAQQTAEAERSRADAEAGAARSAEATAVALQSTAEAARDDLAVALDEAEDARKDAETQAEIANSRKLAAQARTQFGEQLDLGLLLSLEALNAGDTFEARSALYSGIAQTLESASLSFVRYLSGPRAPIYAMAYNADGTRLATGSCNEIDEDTQSCVLGEIRIWNTRFGTQSGLPLTGHSGAVTALAFSPTDPNLLFSGDSVGGLQSWDLSAGEARNDLGVGHTDWVSGLAVTPDGNTLISTSWDGSIRQWSATTGREIGLALRVHQGAVLGLGMSADGSRFATGGEDAQAIVWDTAFRRPLLSLPHDQPVHAIAFTSDDNTLATGNAAGVIRLWDAESGEADGLPLVGHTGTVNGLAFSADDGTLISGSSDGSLLLWDMVSRERFGQPFRGHQDKAVLSVALRPGSNQVASGGGDFGVVIWSLETTETIGQPLPRVDASLSSLAIAPDDSALNAGTSDGRVLRLPIGDSALTVTDLASDFARVIALRQRDATTLGLVNDAGDYFEYSVAAIAAPKTVSLGENGRTISAAAIAPDLSAVAFGVCSEQSDPVNEGDTTVCTASSLVWVDLSVEPPTVSAQLAHSADLSALAFSADGAHLATGSCLRAADSPEQQLVTNACTSGAISLWAVNDGAPPSLLATANFHSDLVTALAFSPDGTTLASGSADSTLGLFDVAGASPLTDEALGGHTGWVTSLAFSPDGNLLASGSRDSNVLLWDVASQQRLGDALSSHAAPVQGVDFTTAGDRLYSVDSDGVIYRWLVGEAAWRTLACEIAGRNLTASEWRQYVSRESAPQETCPSDLLPEAPPPAP